MFASIENNTSDASLLPRLSLTGLMSNEEEQFYQQNSSHTKSISQTWEDSEGREYSYEGFVDGSGKMNGRGILEYPNGVTYEGEFLNNERHGVGKLKLNSDQFAFGCWTGDMPSTEQPWKICMSSDTQYWGFIKVISKVKNTRKKGNQPFSEKEEFSKLITLEAFQPHGEGEMHSNSSAYYGHWENGKRHSYGMNVFKGGTRYYGEWKEDQFHGEGVFLYSDGTIYQGSFRHGMRGAPKHAFGKSAGQGTLILPNGDRIEGRWRGDTVVEASYRKGTPQAAPRLSLHLAHSTLSEGLRQEPTSDLFSTPSSSSSSLSPSSSPLSSSMGWSSLKWASYARMRSEALTKQHHDVADEVKVGVVVAGGLRDVPGYIRSQLRRGKFLGDLLNFFTSAFHGTYLGTEGTERTLSHAVDDVQTLVGYVSGLLQDMVAEGNWETEYRRRIYPSVTRTVERRVCQPLFTLFTKRYEEEDFALSYHMRQLQASPALRSHPLRAMGVAERFMPLNGDGDDMNIHHDNNNNNNNNDNNTDNNNNNNTDGDNTDNNHSHYLYGSYRKAIDRLQLLPSQTCAEEMVRVLDTMRKDVLEEMAAVWQQHDPRKTQATDLSIGSEDLTPVYSYVFLQACLPNYHALFHYLDTFKNEREVELNPVSSVIMFLEVFPELVMGLDPSLTYAHGALMPPIVITRHLEDRINDIAYQARRPSSRQPSGVSSSSSSSSSSVPSSPSLPPITASRLSWLPLLLVHIGLALSTGQGKRTVDEDRERYLSETKEQDAHTHTDADTSGGTVALLDIEPRSNLHRQLIRDRMIVSQVLKDSDNRLGLTVIHPSFGETNINSHSHSNNVEDNNISDNNDNNNDNDNGNNNNNSNNNNGNENNNNDKMETNNSNVFQIPVHVKILREYPSHVYTTVAKDIQRFIKSEL